jgi:hypothetical protein
MVFFREKQKFIQILLLNASQVIPLPGRKSGIIEKRSHVLGRECGATENDLGLVKKKGVT